MAEVVSKEAGVHSASLSGSDGEKHHDLEGQTGSFQIVTSEENNNLARGLKQRHIQMIALAGAIGTGLFLGLGDSLETGGPLGALLGYGLVGLIVCAVQFALGEVSALLPVTGSFPRHAEFFFDPALSFAIGWNVVYGAFLSIPSEISACVVLIQYWTDASPAIFITVIIVLTVAVAIIFVGIYGEVEFFFAMLKILLIVGLIFLGLIIDLGGVPGTGRIGFRYWDAPGPFVAYIASGHWGRFLGFWAVMTNAVYSFSGVESLAVAAAETQNPRQNIPKACKRVFARVFLFYMASILVVGMLVASNDSRLDDAYGTAAESPFVIAASAAGIKAIPSIVNAVVLTSAWSSSNQALLSGSRILYGLSIKGHAPKVFLRTTRYGIPWVAVLFQTSIMLLGYLSVSNNALNVFWWFVDLTAAGVLISWITILANHIRLMQACKVQGIDPNELPWHNKATKYTSWAALVSCIIILFTAGFTVFTKGNWDTASFITSYLDIPIVIVLFLSWKFIKGTKFVALRDIPLRAALDEIARTPETPIPKATGWRRLNFLWS